MSETTIRKAVVRHAKIHIIEDVIELRAKLETHTLIYFRIFQESHIGIERPGSAKDILSRVAEGSDLVGGEGCGVEPFVH